MEDLENTCTHHPQHSNPVGEVRAGLTQHHKEVSGSKMRLKCVVEVTEKILITQGQEPRLQQTDNKKQLGAADNKKSSKNSSQIVGIRKIEENLEGKTLNKLFLVGQTFHQPNSTNTT